MKNEEILRSENLNPGIDKTRKKLNKWLQRDLSLKGHVLLANAEGLSHLTYAAVSLFVNRQICNTTDKLLFDFLWEKQDSCVI